MSFFEFVPRKSLPTFQLSLVSCIFFINLNCFAKKNLGLRARLITDKTSLDISRGKRISGFRIREFYALNMIAKIAEIGREEVELNYKKL